jgi:hypothetical protein
LIKYVDLEINSLQESLSHGEDERGLRAREDPPPYHRRCIGYILKILVNIHGVDETYHSIFIQNHQLNQRLRILATLDEFIAFYANILGIVS